ncbi:Fc.00g114340.m01.CDS01 [Cosmosporella sp. VM-42]
MKLAAKSSLRGVPTGQMTKVGQNDAYLATPGASNAHKNVGILYIPDIFGIWANSKLLADQFALKGYTTLIVDLFNGDAVRLGQLDNLDIMDYIQNGRNGKGGHTTKEIDPIIKEALIYMKTEMGLERVGAAGYCFGGKYVVRNYESGIDVGYMAHPSFVEEDELASITGPLSIAAAEIDSIFPAEKRHRSEEILKKNGNVYQLNLYSGVDHGFAVRRELKEKHVRFAKEQAFLQAVAFFDNWLV